MAAPTFVAAGAAGQGVLGATVPWPAHLADDIGILLLETAAQTPSTPAGWTLIAADTTGTPGADAATGLAAYWKRAASAAEADVAVADPGDHVRGRILTFRGCETSGSPINGTPTTTVNASAVTAVSIAMATTSVIDCFAFCAVSNSTDSTANQTATNDWANAALSGFARLSSGNGASGNGGGFDTAGGEKATAGSIGNTTTVLATASAYVGLSFNLMPPQGGGSATTEGGVYVTTGGKATAGVVSATTATMDASSAQARVMIALKPPTSASPNLPPVITPIPDVQAAVDVELSFNVGISDPEGNALTVTLQPGTTDVPAGAVINSNADGTYDFSWTPTSGQVGDWNIKVRAVDTAPNTTERSFTITVNTTPDPGLLDVARDIAARAQSDVESLEALAGLVEEHEQMNAKVLHDVRRLIADAQATKAYMESVIADLEDGEIEQ